MYILNALTKALISTRLVEGGGSRDGEDVGGPLLSLASKLVLTMQPFPRKSQDVDIDIPLLKLIPKLVLNLHLKGSPSSSSSSMQQQHEAITTMGSANKSCNEAPTNYELKFHNNIPPPPPKVVLGKSNVVDVVPNYGAIESLG
jgi:hypothetical protein